MKNTLFISSLCAALSALSLQAAVHTADSTASFSDAWGKLVVGDSIKITDDVDLAAVGALQSHAFQVDISSDNGSTLTWSGGSGSAPLPASVVYSNLTVSSAPAVLLVGGDVTIGEGNTFKSNNNGVVDASGVVTVKSGNAFDGNIGMSAGGVLKIQDTGSLLVSGGCSFTNNSALGRGGAICLEDATSAPAADEWSAIFDASSSNISFSGNAEDVIVSGGQIVDPGFANDIYVGANRTVKMMAGKGKQIELASGLASADASAKMVKVGAGDLLVGDAEFYAGSLSVNEGRVVLASNRSWGDGSSASSVSVAPGASFVLNSGSTLSQSIVLNGGSLVAHQGAVLNSTLSADSASVITLQLTPAAVQQPSISTSPWLTVSAGGAISQAAADNLTLNLDVTSFATSAEAAGSLFAVDFSNAAGAETAQAVQSLTITYTDASGVHTTNLAIDAKGMLDISSILRSLSKPAFENPVLISGTNSMLSSIGTLAWLKDASRVTAPNAAPVQTSSRVWGSAVGGRIDHSGSSADYDYSGGGYAIGVDRWVSKNTYCGVTVGQAFGSGKSSKCSLADAGVSVDQTAIMLGLYARHMHPIAADRCVTADFFIGYSSVDNEMSGRYSSADWRDNVFTISARAACDYRITDTMFLTPFVALEFSSVSQDDYSVDGNSYSDGKASILSMPVGVTFSNRITECAQKSITPYISAAFVPHLAADNPEASVSDRFGNSAKSRGIEFEDCSFLIQGGIRVEWDDQWTSDISAGVQTDSSQSAWRIGVGASYAF